MFWSLSLLQHTHEIRINELIKILTGNNIMPIQYSLIEAKPITDQQIIRDIEISLDYLENGVCLIIRILIIKIQPTTKTHNSN